MVFDLQGKFRQAFGSVKDHASIGKAMIYYRDGFSSIEMAVLRATSHKDCPIDDKYMHEILFLISNSPGSSVPFLAETISHRLDRTRDCVVALKTLLLIHRLLRGGDRHFEQELRNAYLCGHLRMNTKWFLRNYTDPSSWFLHRYAAFLEERIGWVINQAGKLEPIESKGLEFRFYKEKSIDTVFRRLPKCQVFLDQVLQCSSPHISASGLLLRAAMSNIIKESFQVYMIFCEGIETLEDMIFEFSNAARVSALDILKRASRQSHQLFELYESCKKSICSKNLEYPKVEVISSDHHIAMEQFINCKPTTRSGFLDTKSGSSKIISCGANTIETEDSVIGKEDEERKYPKASTPFSCILETRISMVWVVFDEDEPQESHLSVKES